MSTRPRFATWGGKDSNLEATDFDQGEILERLQNLASTEELSDESFDLVAALFLAVAGSHPKFRLRFETPPPGSEFAQTYAIAKGRVTQKIGDQIDIAVAQGIKQESAVQSAMIEFSLSRREVLRRLKNVREMRSTYYHYNRYDGYAELMCDCPSGFRILPNGRLVPSETNG